jgi:hypothetical protein
MEAWEFLQEKGVGVLYVTQYQQKTGFVPEDKWM